MVKEILFSIVCFTLFMSTLASVCKEPELKVKTFTNDDATVLTHVAYISEFSLSCDNVKESSNLYAAFGDNLVPVARTDDNKYQVSWVQDVTSAFVGYTAINLYDEEGYAAFRKAVRAGEPIENVATVAKFTINHPGAYMGPWLKSEFIAAAVSFVVAYIAFSARTKLLA